MTHNAAKLVRKMRARRAAVERELKAAGRVLAPALNAEAKRIMQEQIYNVPIPLKKSSDRSLPTNAAVRRKTTKGKHGKWQRTGALKRRETARPVGMTVVLENRQRYAPARHALGTSEGRRIVSPGVQSVQWQTEALANKRAFVLQVRRRHVLRALTSP